MIRISLVSTVFLSFYFSLFLVGGGIGDCISDTFTLSSASNKGSPLICGSNSGQHSKYNLQK